MPLPVYRLRRWLAGTAILFTALVVGMYVYARIRARNVLKEVPNKIGYDIKQTASGFQFSKSEGGRTLFTIQAADLKQFKLGDRAQLHKVSIVLYGRDSSRYDQISGDDFTYDPKSGDVTAAGDVQIDLEANPSGRVRPDQSVPQELKNPIHLKTRGLVFNRETGTARTDALTEFQTPQASGSAVGVRYSGRNNSLTLESQVHIDVTGQQSCTINAIHAEVTGDPHQILLDRPTLDRGTTRMQAQHATLFLTSENKVDHVLTTGDVTAEQTSTAKDAEGSHLQARADQAELFLAGTSNAIQTATLIGHVRAERTGPEPVQGTAERVVLDFSKPGPHTPSQLTRVHATQGARLAQQAVAAEKTKAGNSPQDFELTSPAMDFFIADGRRLDRATTSGAAQIVITPAQDQAATKAAAQRTIITAEMFDAQFVPTSDGASRLTVVRGSPGAKITSTAPGQPDRISTSQSVEARFSDQGGIQAITQDGNVVYADTAPDKQTKAWADHARYTPADQMLTLTGSPRVSDAGMATTAQIIRINRATGDALAEGTVKTSYSELKEQPGGALLASSSPIHVTAQKMAAHNNGAVALYTGSARLWQDANVIEAPSIQFDRDHRSVTAQGTSAQPVSTILVQPEPQQPAKAAQPKPTHTQEANHPTPSASTPISITGNRLTYTDAERKAHYETGVTAKGADFTATANTLDAYLLPRSQTSARTSAPGPGQLDRLVAQGNVVVRQPTRRAEGQTLTYLAADDKFVLTGGPPSIFDAEHGKITGVSLTFFRRDDRVLVEGKASTPVVTQTRVAP